MLDKKGVWRIACICGAGLALIGAVFGVLSYLDNNRRLEITLNGQTEMTLEVGSDYVEHRAEALYYSCWGQDTPVEVEITQSVDTEKLGQYIVQYTARYDDLEATVQRQIQVVDTTPPEIVLIADPAYRTPIGQAYAEEGYTATDNYDGDISQQVVAEEKDGVVYYTVADSSGNQAAVERTILYHDPEPPVIALTGGTICVDMGSAYVEPGYTATDNLDGDITNNVTVSGIPNTEKIGAYTVSYAVTDSYGNTASTGRTVYVLPSTEAKPAEPNGKTIYLTFDDGPSQYTGKLLDILAKYNAKATFFVVNTGYIDMISRAAQEGHTVAIHTASHRFEKIYTSTDAYFTDLYRMQSIIEEKTGQRPMLLRFPGGSSNTISRNYSWGIMTRLTGMVEGKGFRYFDWNVDSKDAGGASNSYQVVLNVIAGVGNKSNSVVLQHDTCGFSVNAVERILAWGISNGYTFAALDESSPGCHHGVYN